MKRRIALWATAGFLVAALWAVVAAVTSPTPLNLTQPILWTFIEVTCPIVFASMHFHFGVHLFWVLVANTATYAVVGLVFEAFREQLRHAHGSHGVTARG